VRSVLSNWFFEDRIAPVTKSEIEAAREHGHH
jgi:ubiquinol-cytochrome c reductase cytochrome b subunit